MAVLAAPLKLLTYEAYMAEDEINLRYDIINGERIFMAGTKWWHQRIAGNLTEIFRQYERDAKKGLALSAAFDIIIRRNPLQARQPDVFFISHTLLALAGDFTESGSLEIAPELVVEIVSDSETETRFDAKMTDYCAVGVKECWKVLRETQTVAVLRLSPAGYVLAQTYGRGETVQSLTFPDLTAAIDTIFAQ